MKSLLFFIMILGTPLLAGSPREINFGSEARYGRFMSFIELESWATGRNLTVLRDCPFRDLDDGEAEIIPAEGMDFSLSSPRDGRVYLYLDMVVFRPAASYNPLTDAIHCQTGGEGVRMNNDRTQELKQVRWLSVEVNGRTVKTVYAGGDVYLRSPIVIPIEREVARGGTLNVRLTVSPGDGFFAIWDTFVSVSPDG